MPEQLTQHGIILRTNPVRDADLMVVLLGETTGKVSAVARSARRSKRRFMGGLDLFDCGAFRISVPPRMSQVYALEELSQRMPLGGLRKSLSAFGVAAYCLELADELTVEGDPEGGALLRPLVRSLSAMSAAPSETNRLYALATYFNLIALHVSGYDLLEHPRELPAGVRQWFDEMQATKNAVVPHQEGLTRSGFFTVLRFSEEILGKQLRSGKHLLSDR